MRELSLLVATSVAITVAPGLDHLSVLSRNVLQGRAAFIALAPGLPRCAVEDAVESSVLRAKGIGDDLGLH
ncbi:hypothetical protein IHE31_13990 [Mycetohabitans rhizoxinica]|uniref:hypothetical protein n=1 Tax=Mycetohabitans rhizoxinica TaxID=412963 RepID=UPI0032503CFA